jgi:hypothetical protein
LTFSQRQRLREQRKKRAKVARWTGFPGLAPTGVIALTGNRKPFKLSYEGRPDRPNNRRAMGLSANGRRYRRDRGKSCSRRLPDRVADDAKKMALTAEFGRCIKVSFSH